MELVVGPHMGCSKSMVFRLCVFWISVRQRLDKSVRNGRGRGVGMCP